MPIKASQIKEIKRFEQWEEQIWYYRTHLDVFIEEYFKVKLKDVQKVEARAFGNCDTLYLVQSRGFGKTWICALCCLAMAILYPKSLIAVISGTADQATLVLKKIDEFTSNPNILREIDANGHAPVRLLVNKGRCTLKNGSEIESFSLGTFRGRRAKIIVIDEAPEIKRNDLMEIAKPVRNTTREHCIQLGFPDYFSKMVSITSACLKSNYFYKSFTDTLTKMGKGDKSCFACALDYKSAARVGITTMDFFLKEKESMPEESFMMEYGSVFIGAEEGSLFPYELTEKCRTLRDVEVAMPSMSKADYVMGIDLATSTAKGADNAVIVVIKLVECENGLYLKKVVNIRSFHGKRLDALAEETRKLLVKFPNVSKVVFDHRGLGDAFHLFLSQPWTDPESNKEYPPLVMDTERSNIHNAIPLLHPVVANAQINLQMITATTVALEQESVLFPISSHYVKNDILPEDDEGTETGEPVSRQKRKITMQEKSIYIEMDAMQIEMGNVIAKKTSAGGVIYDVAKATQHKDRYSALAMAINYIKELEDDRKKHLNAKGGGQCIGIVTNF